MSETAPSASDITAPRTSRPRRWERILKVGNSVVNALGCLGGGIITLALTSEYPSLATFGYVFGVCMLLMFPFFLKFTVDELRHPGPHPMSCAVGFFVLPWMGLCCAFSAQFGFMAVGGLIPVPAAISTIISVFFVVLEWIAVAILGVADVLLVLPLAKSLLARLPSP